jgi:redox-sensitive bicupin YhaK (pirin superfamily)
MIIVRPARERGHANHGWLDTHHSFSFADYYDPEHTGFRPLRVINEDRVQPGQGFPTHPHRDMEILTYVLEGGLEHRDSLGTGSVIRPGDMQRMTAGTGVLHSEFNASKDALVHFLQIWIVPEKRSLQPGYEQKTFTTPELAGRLRLIASRQGSDGSVTVHQDVRLYAARLAAGDRVVHALTPGRHACLQVARGKVRLNGIDLEAGDGAAVSDETALTAEGRDPAEILLFDLG